MDKKEMAASAALVEALGDIDRAILACGEAGFSFMNVIEPLMEARQCVHTVARTIYEGIKA